MLKPFTILLLLICVSTSPIRSQQLDHVLGEYLVQLEEGATPSPLCTKWRIFEGHFTKLTVKHQVSNPLNIWLIQFDHTQIHEYRFLESIQSSDQVITAQLNHLITQRQTIPNDPFISLQWQYINDGNSGGVVDADIDAELAWDITTGGLTAQGDEIVVAVLDDGIDADHADLGDNLWVNIHEIPNNNIDDDNNGYIDDYRGWNIQSNTDNIGSGGSHGTPVAGIVGAKGNNEVGVSGVNWDVKMMIVKNDGLNLNEANVLSAYSYPLEMRQLYNDTDGALGAFVVVTNASWGVDFGQPAEFPLWCNFYDTMGEVGILGCGATINENINVDLNGDMPTACGSDYLISVTNLDKTDTKVTGAGYGPISIDLGAHGTGAYTLAANNDYATFSGTSGATPHVTGAVALLYSVPCPSLIEAAKNDPAGTALLVKSYIMDGVDPNASLNGLTLSGGRLNLINSIELLIEACTNCPPPFSLSASDLSITEATLEWLVAPDSEQQNLRWRAVGSGAWNLVNNVQNGYVLMDLEPCTEYEFQLESICATTSSGFSESSIFMTDGCCEPPSFVEVENITTDGFSVSWSSVTSAQSYSILVTELGSGSTTQLDDIELNNITFSIFEPCQTYSVQLQTLCNSGVLTEFTDPVFVYTFGCGACTDFTYCPSQAEIANFEWIQNVSFNALNNTSGSDGGYGDYTGSFTEVHTYGIYPISLTPGFLNPQYDEYFRVWIDYNQDGEFDDFSELAFDAGFGVQNTITGNIEIPGTALPGLTRMRVSMKFVDISDMDPPEACTVEFEYGEVEDYCINIVEGVEPDCALPASIDSLDNSMHSVTLNWINLSNDYIDHNVRYRQLGTFDWTTIYNVDPAYTINDLEDCTVYEAQVEANCTGGGFSGFSNSFVFKTDCLISIKAPTDTLFSINVYPNPFTDQFEVQFDLFQATEISLDLISLDGQITPLISQQLRQSGAHTETFHQFKTLASGLYFVRIRTSNNTITTRLIKQN